MTMFETIEVREGNIGYEVSSLGGSPIEYATGERGIVARMLKLGCPQWIAERAAKRHTNSLSLRSNGNTVESVKRRNNVQDGLNILRMVVNDMKIEMSDYMTNRK
jgi:hypothetical protein